jgi:predicted permease
MTAQGIHFPRLPVFDGLVQDIRYAFWQLRKAPVFAATAILTLALGIGANTTVFTLLHGLLLRSLPVPDSDQLVRYRLVLRPGIGSYWSSFDLSEFGVLSGPMFESVRKHQLACTDIMAWEGYNELTYTERGESRLVRGALVSGSAFQVLGLKAELGRLLDEADDSPGGGGAWSANISYSFWQQEFHGEAEIIGRTLVTNQIPINIVGVLPRGFSGVVVGQDPQIILPLEIDTVLAAQRDRPSIRENQYYSQVIVLGRLKPGGTIAQARANAESIESTMFDEAMPAVIRHNIFASAHRLDVTSAASGWSDYRISYQKPLLIVQALVATVLLLISANLAGLLLARTAGRRHELEIRRALGAGRIRLIRQLLTENAMLTAIAVPIGCLLAWQASRLAVRLIAAPGSSLDIDHWHDSAVIAIAAASGLVTAIFAGSLPALIATRQPRAVTLRSGGRESYSSRHGRVGKVLIPMQVALGLILVTVAALFAASLARLLTRPSGMREEGVFLARTKLEWHPDKLDQLDSLYTQMLQHLAARPGVQSASLVLREPMTGTAEMSHFISREPSGAAHEDNFEHCLVNAIGPGFFGTLGIPIFEGRDFASTDTARSQGVCILSTSAASFFFPTGPAIGGHLEAPSDVARAHAAAYEVVGIVADAKYKTLHEESEPVVYIPYTQQAESVSPAWETPSPHSDLSFVIRGSDSLLVSSAYRETLREFVPDRPIFDVVSLERHMMESISADRLIASLSSFLGFLALLLTCISLYGHVAWNVAERTPEIGIRMALGATRSGVVRMMCSSLAAPIAIGIGAGIGGAIAISRVLVTLLYDARPVEPKLVLLSLGAMLVAAGIAAYIPARRAASVDPMRCLRTD